ncbi:MAG: CPBP family intramembrane metalloprotease [Deltaproteobacteria bacterium]|nr:CPBP family intramembrane metalloprotease [Deltaproteobacteria bacterium]
MMEKNSDIETDNSGDDYETESSGLPIEGFPLGIAGSFFLTAGTTLLTFFISMILALILVKLLKMPLDGVSFIVVSIAGSSVWGVSAFISANRLILPADVLSFKKEISLKLIILIVFLIPFVILCGSQLETIALYFHGDFGSNAGLSMFVKTSILAPWTVLLTLFAVSVVAPVSEELFFRGVIVRSLMLKKFSPALVIGFSAVLFAAVHMQIKGFFLLSTVGGVLAIIRMNSSSLVPSVIFHSLYNFLVISISILPVIFSEPEFNEFSLKYTDAVFEKPDLKMLSQSLLLAALSLFLVFRILGRISSELSRINSEDK